jgi:polyisoprenoid-binding protein YceI
MRFALVALSVVAFSGSAQATEYDLDAAHTNVGFSVRHMMVTNVKGEFDKFKAVVSIDDKDITKSKVTADIETGSVNTRTQKRDDHLRSPDFFDAAKFPTMSFASTKFEKNGDKIKVYGTLTIKGITKPAVLDATLTAAQKDPFMGAMHMGFTAEGKISRKDYGLVWNKSLEGGGVLVGDEVKLEIDGELVQKAATKS